MLPVVWCLLALLGYTQAFRITNEAAQISTVAGRTTSVTPSGLVLWDRFSLRINGTRVFLQSAEFHYQRLPVPELWLVRPPTGHRRCPNLLLTVLDIFQKFKANGFNAVR